MWRCTCVPRTVYDFLSPFTPLFRGAQARHFVIFCWLVVAIIRDPGVGRRKGAWPYVPAGLSYWALLRMLRSGQWDAQAVMSGMTKQVLRSFPPAADGVLSLIGNTTHQPKRGRQHPLGHFTHQRESSPYPFGFGMVVLIASWDRFRMPIALAPIDPTRKGHQNILCRQMRKDFEPSAWVQEVVVGADVGSPANPTLKRIKERGWTYVFAMSRTRKFTNGKYGRDVVHHLPKSLYRRRATTKPDGRQDYWVFPRHAELHQLGAVTIVLSKKRRNVGPQRVTIIVTNLRDASAGAILSHYAWRWGVELFQSQDIKCSRGYFFFLVCHHRWFFKGQHVVHVDRPIGMPHDLFHQQLDHRLAVRTAEPIEITPQEGTTVAQIVRDVFPRARGVALRCYVFAFLLAALESLDDLLTAARQVWQCTTLWLLGLNEAL